MSTTEMSWESAFCLCSLGTSLTQLLVCQSVWPRCPHCRARAARDAGRCRPACDLGSRSWPFAAAGDSSALYRVPCQLTPRTHLHLRCKAEARTVTLFIHLFCFCFLFCLSSVFIKLAPCFQQQTTHFSLPFHVPVFDHFRLELHPR